MEKLPGQTPKVDDLTSVCEEVRLTRRSVTVMLVGAFAIAAPAAAAQIRRQSLEDLKRAPGLSRKIRPILAQTYSVRRPDDFLFFDYTLNNLRVRSSSAGPVIERIKSSQDAWVVIEHQPQSIDEQAYWEVEGQPTDAAPTPQQPAISRISGPSRLVFQMPTGTTRAPWGLDGLLDASRTWPMRLDPLAKPPPADFLRFIIPRRVYKRSMRRLDEATQVLLASLPAEQRLTIGDALPVAAKRIGNRIKLAALRGKKFTDQQINTLVGRELGAVLARTSIVQSVEQSFWSRHALEAAAVSVSLAALSEMAQAPALRRQKKKPVLQRLVPAKKLPTVTPENLSRIPGLFALMSLIPHKPDDAVTAIELPYRLLQTPLATGGWSHAKTTVTHNQRTELWHTRLGTRKNDSVVDLSPEPLRAIWSPDYPAAKSAMSGVPRFALYGDERRDLVRLSAGFNEKTPAGSTFVPRPMTAKKLLLSALGATLDLDGNWRVRPGVNTKSSSSAMMARAPLPAVDIESWSHKAAIGRDYFVRVVKAGRLYPFGHAASLVRITERKFETRSGGGRVAVLRQRAFIIVREPVREYTGSRQTHQGRDFPFRRVEILTNKTPDLNPPGGQSCDRVFSGTPYDVAFVPVTGNGEDFKFRLVGIDGAGRRIPFSAPLVLVLDSKNNASDIAFISQFYSNGKNGCSVKKRARGTVPVFGAVIQFAPQSAGGDLDGDTNIPTETVTFRGAPPSSGVAIGEPKYFPAVEKAKVVLPAVKTLLGSDKSPTIVFHEKFLIHGFSGANTKGQLFVKLQMPGSISVSPSEPSDKFGGMITPDLSPSALSRKFGVVAGANDAKSFFEGDFKPGDFLPNAKLLGAIELKDILQSVVNIVSEKEKTPKFTSVELPDRIEATYSLEQAPLKSLPPIFEAMPGSRLKIDTKIIARRDKLNVPPPEASVEGLVENFQINLFSCLILTFDKLSFVTTPGKKPKVDVDLDPEFGVMFGGPLEFINELKDIIPSNGFADPSPISLTPTGITAGYSLALPTVQVGICSMSNIAIGAKFSIPFTGGPPSARFNFAERESPFNITVSMFGGGGFVAVVVDTAGMREIEASLEFGAKIEIDLGVASGGVYIKGGFYFHLVDDAGIQSIYFEGFVEMGGHLSIIGLISVSLVFHLALAYEKDGAAKTSLLFGQASLIVEVEVLFFSASVSVKVERQFIGSEADPLFIDFVPNAGVWQNYCGAFA